MKTTAALSLASLIALYGCGGSSSNNDSDSTQAATGGGQVAAGGGEVAAAPEPAPEGDEVLGATDPGSTPRPPPNEAEMKDLLATLNHNHPHPPAAVFATNGQPVTRAATWPATAELHLFSTEATPTYLGCLNCKASDPLDVCKNGDAHGSSEGIFSVWNEAIDWGNPQGTFSPWNPTSPDGPVVVAWDKSKAATDPTAFVNYGQWTTNATGPWKYGRTAIPLLNNVADSFLANKSIRATRTLACGVEEGTPPEVPVDAASQPNAPAPAGTPPHDIPPPPPPPDPALELPGSELPDAPLGAVGEPDPAPPPVDPLPTPTDLAPSSPPRSML